MRQPNIGSEMLIAAIPEQASDRAGLYRPNCDFAAQFFAAAGHPPTKWTAQGPFYHALEDYQPMTICFHNPHARLFPEQRHRPKIVPSV